MTYNLGMAQGKKIGLIGTNGAGKSTVCDYLRELDFTVISLSDFVRESLSQDGKSHSRDHLIERANQLKAEHGQDVLAKKAFTKYSKRDATNVVFDSIRNAHETRYLKSKNVILIGVDATVEKRYDRILQRQRASDLIDFNTFVRHDELEMKGLSSGQNIEAAIADCDYKINNNGSLSDLHRDIENVLQCPVWDIEP
jgi:dephospho-CoA kinase